MPEEELHMVSFFGPGDDEGLLTEPRHHRLRVA
jgi:hypothetical protein